MELYIDTSYIHIINICIWITWIYEVSWYSCFLFVVILLTIYQEISFGKFFCILLYSHLLFPIQWKHEVTRVCLVNLQIRQKSTKTYNKIGIYDACTIFQVFWSHTTALREKQTELKHLFSVVILKPCFLIHTWRGDMTCKYDVSWYAILNIFVYYL